MLKNQIEPADLIKEKQSLKYIIPKEVQNFFNPDNNQLWEIHYPVLHYPKKVTSLNLEKVVQFQGKLIGIKGQYLIFDDGTVFNVRNAEGLEVLINLL